MVVVLRQPQLRVTRNDGSDRGKTGDFRGNGPGRGNRLAPGEATIRVPPGVNWLSWRVAMSDEFKTSPIEVETKWSVADVFAANSFLDQIEENNRRRAAQVKK